MTDKNKWPVPEFRIKEIKDISGEIDFIYSEYKKLKRKADIQKDLMGMKKGVLWDKLHEYTHAPENKNIRFNEEDMCIETREDSEINPFSSLLKGGLL